MGPKTATAYRTLRDRISTGQYPPGARLPSERTLAEDLGIGRTALRQVLTRLVMERVIEVHARSSYRVPARPTGVPASDGPQPWLIHGERTAYDSPWVTISLVDVEPPGVDRFEHHVVRLPRAAVAAVLDDRDRVLMLWRYRFITGTTGWELPGGLVGAGETPAEAAARETEEETGWRPGALEHVVTYQPMVGAADAPHDVFTGRGATQVGDPSDAEEAGHVAWVPLADVPRLMRSGELAGSGTLVALLHLLATRGEPPHPRSVGLLPDAPGDLAARADDYLAEGFGGSATPGETGHS